MAISEAGGRAKFNMKTNPSPAQIAGRIQPGQVLNPLGAPKGRRLTTVIRDLLKQRSKKNDSNKIKRIDDVAEAYVAAMERGEFQFIKEYIERDEGKVPMRLADADGEKVKLYLGMPLEGEGAP